jgi:hypothetical protein
MPGPTFCPVFGSKRDRTGQSSSSGCPTDRIVLDNWRENADRVANVAEETAQKPVSSSITLFPLVSTAVQDYTGSVVRQLRSGSSVVSGCLDQMVTTLFSRRPFSYQASSRSPGQSETARRKLGLMLVWHLDRSGPTRRKRNYSLVDGWRGAYRPVSTRLLSNRACGFPAHGLPMVFTCSACADSGTVRCREVGTGHDPKTIAASIRSSGRPADSCLCASP